MCSEQNKIPNEIFMPNLKKLGSSTALFTSLLTFSRRDFKNRGRITAEVIGHNWYSQSSQAEALPAHGCGYYRHGGGYQHLCWMAHYCEWQNKYMLVLSGEENYPPPPSDQPHFLLLNTLKAI